MNKAVAFLHKNWAYFIILLAILDCIIYLYPTESKVLNGYKVTNAKYSKDIKFTINPSDYKLNTKNSLLVHKKIYEKYDTGIYFEKIIKDTAGNGRIHILLKTITKWKFLSGSCLSNVIVIDNDNGRSFSRILNKPCIVDNLGKNVPYLQIGSDPSYFLTVSFGQQELYKHQSITISFNELNYLSYDLGFPFN